MTYLTKNIQEKGRTRCYYFSLLINNKKLCKNILIFVNFIIEKIKRICLKGKFVIEIM